MKRIYKTGFVALLGLGLMAAPKLSSAASVGGTSAASVVTPVTVVATTAAINLGSFAAGTGGTLTLAPNGSGGAITAGGGITHFGSQQEAVFTVSGVASTAYTFAVASAGDLTGPTGSGTLTMTPTYSHNAATSLDGSGSDVVEVGASVVVAADQAAGSYSGTFTVTVNY